MASRVPTAAIPTLRGSSEPHRILLTGATGTLGRNIVQRLAGDAECTLLLPLRRLADAALFEKTNVQICHGDFESLDFAALIENFQPTSIVHCAASGVQPPRSAWFNMVDFNVSSTLRLFQAACRFPSVHFIYISTGLTYMEQNRPLTERDPIASVHPYGASKAAADLLLQAGAAEFAIPLSIIRPFSFSGRHDVGLRLFPSILRAAETGNALDLSACDQVRDFCSVADVAYAVELVIKQHTPRGIVNIGSGQDFTLRQVIENVCRDLALQVDLRFGSVPYHAHEPMHLVADTKKAQSFGWKTQMTLSHAIAELAAQSFPEAPVMFKAAESVGPMPHEQFAVR